MNKLKRTRWTSICGTCGIAPCAGGQTSTGHVPIMAACAFRRLQCPPGMCVSHWGGLAGQGAEKLGEAHESAGWACRLL